MGLGWRALRRRVLGVVMLVPEPVVLWGVVVPPACEMQAKRRERLGNGSMADLRRRGRGTFARLECRVGKATGIGRK